MADNLQTESVVVSAFPLRADEVNYCPPHHWVVQDAYEECKKCGDQRNFWNQPIPVKDPLAAMGEPTQVFV